MTIKVTDFDKVEAWTGGRMLGEGTHDVYIESATEGTSSKGNPQVEVEFIASDGSGSIRDWLTFTEKARGKAKMLLEAVAIESVGGEWEFPTESLIGRRLSIEVTEQAEPDRDNPGETRMRRRVTAFERSTATLPGDEPKPGNGSGSDLPF